MGFVLRVSFALLQLPGRRAQEFISGVVHQIGLEYASAVDWLALARGFHR